MGPQLGQKESSGNGDSGLVTDGGNESKTPLPDLQLQDKKAQAMNEKANSDPPEVANALAHVEEEEEGISTKDTNNKTKSTSESALLNVEFSTSNPDKLVSAAQDETAQLLPGNPTDEAAVSGGAALSPSGGGLGSLLKGSPFEEEPSEKAGKLESSALSGNKSDPTLNKANSKTNGGGFSSKGPTEKQQAFSRPSAITTKKDAHIRPTARNAKSADEPNDTAKPAHSPVTKTTAGRQAPSKPSSPRQPLSKTSSPRQPIAPKGPLGPVDRDSTKAPVSKASRASTVSNGHTIGVAKPRISSLSSTAPAATRTGRTSPPSKPRPKSPTRTARLPASATASTASSAAKLGGAPPPRSPSRVSTTAGTKLGRKPSTLNKERTGTHPLAPSASTLSGVLKKSTRPSLSAPSQPNERPRSRTSIASSKLPEEGFLARMMRPTASSASKAHEKIEPKSPPKAAPAGFKRKSGGSDELKGKKTEEPQNPTREQDDIIPVANQGRAATNGSANGNRTSAEPISSQ
ncbi:hypothetical protein MMC24_006841 [Lignoscripta atroalba]|nr:hypothetical protein [Lignoscripta atroalba]